MPGEILYDNAVMNAKLAQRPSEICGILWHQGESDSLNVEDRDNYRERFMNMLNGMTCPSVLQQLLGFHRCHHVFVFLECLYGFGYGFCRDAERRLTDAFVAADGVVTAEPVREVA